MVAAVSISAVGGAVAGQNERYARATQTTMADLSVQFELGIQDLQAGRTDLAVQRFRWILERDPTYPGIAEQLAAAEQLVLPIGGTSTPTLAPASSDQDLETLFAEAQRYHVSGQWENAITRLEEIQGRDPRFREAEVKELLFSSLQSLGLIYIRGNRIEEGILLLEQAAQIRPLDDAAQGEVYLGTLYLTGQSYWGLDWRIVIQNFEAITEVAPNYRDVPARLPEAYTFYGDQLFAQGAGCDAEQAYLSALELKADEEVTRKAEAAHELCLNPALAITETPDTALSLTPSPTNEGDGGGTGIPTPLPTTTPLPTGDSP